MDNKKRSLRRLTVLYVLFFFVIAMSVVLSFNVTAFNEGFSTGLNDARRMMADSDDNQRSVDIFYDLATTTRYMDFEIPIYDHNGVLVKARPSVLDIEAISHNGKSPRGTGMSMFFGILSLMVYAAIFVVIFVIITSLRKSVRRGDPFRRGNVVLTRLIGILLIAGSLIHSLGVWMERRALATYFADSPYELTTSFPFNFGQVIMGLLIFVVAEIFVIGYSLSEEQKLTI